MRSIEAKNNITANIKTLLKKDRGHLRYRNDSIIHQNESAELSNVKRTSITKIKQTKMLVLKSG